MKRTIGGVLYEFEPNDDRKRRMLAEFGIDCDGVCDECCGPCPPHLADGTSYRRQASDYLRPQKAVQLGDIAGEAHQQEIVIAGTFHCQEVLETFGVAATLALELVPEPGSLVRPPSGMHRGRRQKSRLPSGGLCCDLAPDYSGDQR
jgi:hypothetical protein